MTRRFLNLLALSAVLGALCSLLLCCGRDGSAVLQQSYPGLPGAGASIPAAELSSLPDIFSLRSASAEAQKLQNGSEALNFSSNVEAQGSELLLDNQAPGSTLQWALYGFELLPGQSLQSIDVDFNLEQGSSAWLALADFSLQRWTFSGPLAASGNVGLSNSAHLSPAGRMFCAVLAPPGSVVRVQQLRLHILDQDNKPPVAVLTPEVISGNAPLTVFFDAQDSNAGGDSGDAIVEYAWDWDANGDFDLIGSSPQETHDFSAGVHQIRLRVTDSAGASAVDDCLATVNAPPEASLLVSDEIAAGVPTLLDGSGSSDPDGDIVLFEWDTDGDGSFESSSGSEPLLEHVFPHGGSLELGLRVTDDFGAQATASASISVRGWADGKTLEDEGYCGQYSNLLLVDGRPAVAFHDGTSNDLRFVRSLDAKGDQWGDSSLIDAGGMVGVDLSMAIVNGQPAISYQEVFDGDLFYVRAKDSAGEEWSSPLLLDSDGYTGRTTSLRVVDGRPALGYSRLGATILFMRALDADGLSWPAGGTVVESGGTFCSDVSLAVIDNAPALAWCTEGDLGYARALDADGSSWASPLVLQDTGNGDAGCELGLIGGKPVIVFNGAQGSCLQILHSLDLSGMSWLAPQVLDSTPASSSDCCLASFGGLPAISYFDSASGDLRLLVSTDLLGQVWALPQVLDSDGQTGRWSSLLDLGASGSLISYFDSDRGDLRLVRYQP